MPDVTPINDNESEARNGDSGHLEDLSNTTQLSDKNNEGDSGHQDDTSMTTKLGDKNNGETEHQDMSNPTQSGDKADIALNPDKNAHQPSKAGPYIIPQMRQDAAKLNPLADDFIPRPSIPIRARLPQRECQKPKWMLSDNWRLP